MAGDRGDGTSFGWMPLAVSVGALIAACSALYVAAEKYVKLRDDIKEVAVIAKQAELQNRIFALAREEAALEHRKMEWERGRLEEREQAVARREMVLKGAQEDLAKAVSDLSNKACKDAVTKRLVERGHLPGFVEPPQGVPVPPEIREASEIVIYEPRDGDRIEGSTISVTGRARGAGKDSKVLLFVEKKDEEGKVLKWKDKEVIAKDCKDVEKDGLWLGVIKLDEQQLNGKITIWAHVVEDPATPCVKLGTTKKLNEVHTPKSRVTVDLKR